MIVDVNTYTLKDRKIFIKYITKHICLKELQKFLYPTFRMCHAQGLVYVTILNTTKSRSNISVNVQHLGSVTLLKSCTMKTWVFFSLKERRNSTVEKKIYVPRFSFFLFFLAWYSKSAKWGLWFLITICFFVVYLRMRVQSLISLFLVNVS